MGASGLALRGGCCGWGTQLCDRPCAACERVGGAPDACPSSWRSAKGIAIKCNVPETPTVPIPISVSLGIMDTRPTNVDDSDFDAIHYATNESWNHRQDQSHFQGGTFTEGFTNARAELRFNGTSVTVYGIATPRPSGNRTAVPPSVAFSVDDGIPTTVVGDPGVQNGETAHQFYLSPALPPREHILQINVTYGEEDWPFVLDYIQYVPSTESGAASGWGPTEGGLSAAAPKHPGAPVAAIVGSVMGCLALLGAAVLLRFYWYFRKGSTKTKKRGSYIYISAATKVDLLDNEPKLLPPSRALTPEPAADIESAFAASEMRYHSRSPSLNREYLLSPPGLQRSFIDMSEADAESRPSSPPYNRADPRPSSPPCNRPGTPSASSVHGYQRSPTPSSLSFALLSRPGTPAAVVAFQRPITPPVAMHRPETPSLPAIVYRPATPEGFALLPIVRAGPSGTSKALQLEKEKALRASKQPKFYSDSGVRFKEGEVPPTMEAVMASSHAAQAKAERDRERKKREKEKHVSYGGSAISEVPPEYTEE
ncbi:hypothetical protein OH76DRAFT_762359 [Lentinus brumalis]|uniref:Uncharacterized protein n=1 Tax=Lentinus brumalis TaxID=2498619 RepID=A0A371DSZ9_9APHY|nr:hypothetical protein OH76DRAFT_762359 [Polyporus brumalis]